MSLFTDAIASLRPARDASPRRDGYNWSLPTVRAGSIDLVAELTASYEQIYHSQPWVAAAVNKLSRSVGMLPLKTYIRGEGRNREQVYDNDLAKLLREPFHGGTPSYWKQHVVGSTAVWGNGLLVKLGADDRTDVPDELFPAPAVGWSLGENDTYVWTSPHGEMFPFPRWQIIHFKYWDTAQNGFGASPLETLRRTLAIEDAATRFGVAAFKNGVRPASVLRSDNELSESVIKRLRANIENLYGNVDRAFRVAILEQGLDWKPLSHNLNDAAVINHRKLTREEAAAVYDVPQPTIGILENANFASVNELHQMYYQDTMGPWLRMFEETLTVEFIDMIPQFDGMFIEFDMGMILRGNINTRSIAYQRFISSGIMTPNEVRALENLPPSPNPLADDIHIPANLSPNPAVAGAMDQVDPEEGADDE